MSITSLGYIELQVTDLAQWQQYAERVLGVEAFRDEEADSLLLRIDEFPYRFVLRTGPVDTLVATGWEVESAEELDVFRSRLSAAGIEYREGRDDLAVQRRVIDVVSFTDPAGNTVELFHGMALNHKRVLGRYGTRFVTEDQGLGHLVLGVDNDAQLREFYVTVLGFQLRDAIAVPSEHVGRPAGQAPSWVQFLGCNPRHHSLAFFPGPTPTGIIHIMLEVDTPDEVGMGLDRAKRQHVPLSSTLGRHVNDKMYSFYMKTPSGFDLEYGSEGLRVDRPGEWVTRQSTALSYWGHDFSIGR